MLKDRRDRIELGLPWISLLEAAAIRISPRPRFSLEWNSSKDKRGEQKADE